MSDTDVMHLLRSFLLFSPAGISIVINIIVVIGGGRVVETTSGWRDRSYERKGSRRAACRTQR